METLRYVLGLVVVVFYPPALLYWLLIHPLAGWWRRRGPVVALTTVLAVCVAVSVLLFLAHEPLMGRDLGTNPWLVAAGLLLYGASLILEMRTRKQLDLRTLTGVSEVSEGAWRRGPGGPGAPGAPGDGLLTEGIYARVRHPRYLGVILGTVGFSLVVNYVGVYVLVGAFIPVLYAVVVLEERELVERFGEAYRDYQGRVPRLIPRLGRGPDSEAIGGGGLAREPGTGGDEDDR